MELEENSIEIDKKREMKLRQPLLVKNRRNHTSQHAIVGANICPIESLDYEFVSFPPLLIFFLFLFVVFVFVFQ